MATPVPDAYKIPGAILFMTITFKEGTRFGDITIDKSKQNMNIVAYDPKLTKNETLEAIQARYFKDGLPYFERFSPLGADAATFETTSGNVYFVGQFGGKNKPSPKSITWDKAVTGAHVTAGLTLVYWNEKGNNKAQGMFTAPGHAPFQSHGKATFMNVYAGPGAKVATQGLLTLLEAEKFVLSFYATHDGENPNLKL